MLADFESADEALLWAWGELLLLAVRLDLEEGVEGPLLALLPLLEASLSAATAFLLTWLLDLALALLFEAAPAAFEVAAVAAAAVCLVGVSCLCCLVFAAALLAGVGVCCRTDLRAVLPPSESEFVTAVVAAVVEDVVLALLAALLLALVALAAALALAL